MLEDQMWFEPEEALAVAWRQGVDEGREIGADEAEMREVASLPRKDPEKRRRAFSLLDRWESAGMRVGYPWLEPDDLESIRKQREGGKGVRKPAPFLREKVYAAWLMRAAGCLLGKPVEGWYRDRIEGLLREAGNLPVRRYAEEPADGMPEDDDTNYTILALKLMEEKGWEFTPDDVGELWLASLPVLHLCTAERVAYLNMCNGFCPPRSARHHNAYREYVGAQIRGDFFGYVCPGDPEKAAELAWRDASISHVKNGIYGEMFVAAMLAEAAVTSRMEDIVRAGMGQIPQKSRLWAAVAQALDWWKNGTSAAAAVENVRKRFDETCGYDWCHVIPNAIIVCIGLLYGEGDFTKTVDLCLRAAFDTDCNCATAGSVVGMAMGIREADRGWIEPLKDKIHSGVDGMGTVRISDLADRTQRVFESRVQKA